MLALTTRDSARCNQLPTIDLRLYHTLLSEGEFTLAAVLQYVAGEVVPCNHRRPNEAMLVREGSFGQLPIEMAIAGYLTITTKKGERNSPSTLSRRDPAR